MPLKQINETGSNCFETGQLLMWQYKIGKLISFNLLAL
jgi:hypothetical protein